MVGAKRSQEALIRRMGEELKPDAKRVLYLIQQTLRVARSLSAELSPPALQNGDFSTTISAGD